MQVQTQTMTVYPDYYDNKDKKRSFSVTVMQPVSIAVELSPVMGGNLAQMQELMAKAKDEGLEVQINYQNSTDNWGKPKMVVYDVKPVTAKPTSTVSSNKG